MMKGILQGSSRAKNKREAIGEGKRQDPFQRLRRSFKNLGFGGVERISGDEYTQKNAKERIEFSNGE